MQHNKLVGIFELILAAAFWGFGFIAAVWALKEINFLELTWLRFALVGAVGLPFFWFRRGRYNFSDLAKRSFFPAVLLLATLLLQTWGLKYTSATKSGFITTLYVVFIPLLESTIRRTLLPIKLWFCVALAFIGTILIVNVGLGEINFGDVLTLLCAIAAAGQIYWLGIISPRIGEPFIFNLAQCYWAMLLLLPLAIFQPMFQGNIAPLLWSTQAWIGLLSLAFGSTMLAFYLQVRAQARLSLTVSSLLFLLESPFALFFAVLLLGETLSEFEAVGAFLILLAAVLASLFEAQSRRGEGRRTGNDRRAVPREEG